MAMRVTLLGVPDHLGTPLAVVQVVSDADHAHCADIVCSGGLDRASTAQAAQDLDRGSRQLQLAGVDAAAEAGRSGRRGVGGRRGGGELGLGGGRGGEAAGVGSRRVRALGRRRAASSGGLHCDEGGNVLIWVVVDEVVKRADVTEHAGLLL